MKKIEKVGMGPDRIINEANIKRLNQHPSEIGRVVAPAFKRYIKGESGDISELQNALIKLFVLAQIMRERNAA